MFSTLKNNISIVYQGGSGGFLLYYLLLLQRNHPSDVWPRIRQQFPPTLKTNQKAWKQTEIWPELNSVYRVNLICNPLFCKDMYTANKEATNNTSVILLWADLDTQLRLAYDKNAYWFTDVSRKEFNAPSNDLAYLRTIKSNYDYFKGVKVDPLVPELVKEFNPEVSIKLHHIVQDKKMFNENQQEFIDFWLGLQTPKSLRCLTNGVSIGSYKQNNNSRPVDLQKSLTL